MAKYNEKDFTLRDMERFAGEAWGPLGTNTFRKWVEFNDRYFAGKLRPIPLVITHVQLFGRRMAFCSHNAVTGGRTITVNVPKMPGSAGNYPLFADNGNLLHGMVHQLLRDAGEPAGHDSEGWQQEVMRLHRLITGKEIWAGRSMTKRVEGSEGRLSRVVGVNEERSGVRVSMTQLQIAEWPHCGHGIDLGRLGRR